ncbi:zinc finger, RING/FYVE/PHD-type containing protein [Tanacetum coccineum]|uniref:Zinc finger, RING/FYVE/PHD-type containing protein n=1 Tax=Tanacetum coccineum TaxID=301880 RepID=A0ABQ5D140_9ASTR
MLYRSELINFLYCPLQVRSFYSALKALSRKEMHYGSYATLEQVSEAGDMCAICQEKMQAPILLCCSHIFCEDCLKESERALYAELWLGQPIYDHLVMVPQVFSSGCSKVPLSDMGFCMAVIFCAKCYSQP